MNIHMWFWAEAYFTSSVCNSDKCWNKAIEQTHESIH